MLVAQPVVRLSDQQPVHHEILLRLRDDDGKIIMPGNFIEIAESLGLIQEIDMRVVEKLLLHHARAQADGQEAALLRQPVAREHLRPELGEALHSDAGDQQADPSQLVFEITETAAMSEIDVTVNFIKKLKDMGCRFALDDFGAGFSSFYYLKRFEVDYLKIDGSFIRDLAGEDGSNRTLRESAERCRHRLNKQVIAEWVETPKC